MYIKYLKRVVDADENLIRGVILMDHKIILLQ